MSTSPALEQFKTAVMTSLEDGSFIKISLGNYKGSVNELKNIYVRLVEIKREDMLSLTYRYKTRDVVKNFSAAEGLQLIVDHIVNGFAVTTLFTREMDFSVEQDSNGEYRARKKAPSLQSPLSTNHNKEKKRLVSAAEKNYLYELKLTDENGLVFKNAQDKYKQINQYIALLSPMLKELKSGDLQHVADMGSGKGYLTFALYDYLHHVLKLETKVTGIEYREDLVELCNGIALNSGFKDLSFVQGTIQDYPAESIDLLIALHACDTATDDAIFKGIQSGAKLIVVAPCCHKQIRREMSSAKKKNELDFLLKHGIFLERQAEMVTDGIRALIMEYFGYKTKIMEFISDAHTPKNILVVGVKKNENEVDKAAVLKKIQDTKKYFGIGYHHLERLFGLDI